MKKCTLRCLINDGVKINGEGGSAIFVNFSKCGGRKKFVNIGNE